MGLEYPENTQGTFLTATPRTSDSMGNRMSKYTVGGMGTDEGYRHKYVFHLIFNVLANIIELISEF